MIGEVCVCLVALLISRLFPSPSTPSQLTTRIASSRLLPCHGFQTNTLSWEVGFDAYKDQLPPSFDVILHDPFGTAM